MKNYEVKTVKIPQMISVTCDVCKDVIVDEMEMQEMIHIEHVGGYNSIIGDCKLIELDICQHCFVIAFRDAIYESK